MDFEELRLLRPNQRLLRRTQEPGVWAAIALTTHGRRMHARLHRLQVDQQLPLPTFPVVLAPVPPPRSVANDDPSGQLYTSERILELGDCSMIMMEMLCCQKY